MIIDSHVDCIACVVDRANTLADQYLTDKKEKYEFMKEVLELILSTEYDKTAPYLTGKVMRLIDDKTGVNDFYRKQKLIFNNEILKLYPKFKQFLDASDTPLFDAIKLSIAGNIIDLGAFDEISFALVDEVIDKVSNEEISPELFNQFQTDLSNAETLLYIGDNSGEIVFDKLLIEVIKKYNQGIDITFVVRGATILNDITQKDAKQVGIDRYATIIDNGTDLPGTDLTEVSQQFLDIFNNSDLIISKGQGNYESLSGCQKNVYYLLLCKCEILQQHLNKNHLDTIFLHENHL